VSLSRRPSARGRRLIAALAFGQDDGDDPAMRAFCRRHARWWDQRGVIGVAVGPKHTAGRRAGLAVVVLVRRKLVGRKLRPGQRVPRTLDARSLGMGKALPTDVRAVGVGRLESLFSAERPAHPGFNVGNELEGSGTITCLLRARTGGALLALSCTHVIGRFGDAGAGEVVMVPSRDEAEGMGVLGRAPIGVLERVLPLGRSFADGLGNVDAATFRPGRPADVDAALALVGVRPTGVCDDVSVGMKVHKVGATSGLTFGEVTAIHATIGLGYPTPSGGMATVWFSDAIGISQFTRPGDSGALVLDEQDRAVGLHIGSLDDSSICLPIQRVLDALDCDLA
jgi:hypothetical protein